MKRPEEIATDVRRELIREAARSISHRGGRLSAGRIARDARLPKPTVVALLPTFGEEELRDLADAVDGEQAEKPERELAAVA